MQSTKLAILGTLVTLALLSGCASTGADLSVDGNGSSGHGDDILQTMERDSARG